MNWALIGWGVIGFALVLLAALQLWFKKRGGYQARHFPEIDKLEEAQTIAIERGLRRTVVLGHQLSSLGYPGLGLNSLAALPGFLNQESLSYGKMSISASEGSLAVFARQIIENRYQDGFSDALIASKVKPVLLGPTPFSFSAGLLSDLGIYGEHGLVLTGHFGPEAALWSEICASKNGQVFAAAGTIDSQASLYTHVDSFLLGESSFFLPGMIHPSLGKQAGWLAEDILRLVLILSILLGAILKMVGVL